MPEARYFIFTAIPRKTLVLSCSLPANVVVIAAAIIIRFAVCIAITTLVVGDAFTGWPRIRTASRRHAHAVVPIAVAARRIFHAVTIAVLLNVDCTSVRAPTGWPGALVVAATTNIAAQRRTR